MGRMDLISTVSRNRIKRNTRGKIMAHSIYFWKLEMVIYSALKCEASLLLT
jgi:hypothetical protein